MPQRICRILRNCCSHRNSNLRVFGSKSCVPKIYVYINIELSCRIFSYVCRLDIRIHVKSFYLMPDWIIEVAWNTWKQLLLLLPKIPPKIIQCKIKQQIFASNYKKCLSAKNHLSKLKWNSKFFSKQSCVAFLKNFSLTFFSISVN